MGIFAGVPWKGGVKRQWSCRKLQFSVYSLFISSEALEIRPTLFCYIPSTAVTLYCRVTLKENSNNDMFDNFHYVLRTVLYGKITSESAVRNSENLTKNGRSSSFKVIYFGVSGKEMHPVHLAVIKHYNTFTTFLQMFYFTLNHGIVTGRWVCDDRFYGLVNRSNR